MKDINVRTDSYYDSVFLMTVDRAARELDVVNNSVVAMGTPVNIDLMIEMGYPADKLADVGPNDMVIAIDAENRSSIDVALESIDRLLRERQRGADAETERHPATLRSALKRLPDANVAIISLPGAYAALEAARALDAGLHVMLFSDNVSIEEEARLKRIAVERGLLMMGPDCGTAIINGKPLCFANVIRRGRIGIVAASGTGLQEVSCLIDRSGEGISQAIGTGGRDLRSEQIGGAMTLMGIEALAGDAATEVIVVISKPPVASIAVQVIDVLQASKKPGVVHFLGLTPESERGVVRYAGNLQETAAMAVALASGQSNPIAEPDDIEEITRHECAAMAPEQRWLRGLFSGGTLADEALFMLEKPLGEIHSFEARNPDFVLRDPNQSIGHTIVDLGEDVFTAGRPHPMIDPTMRAERIRREASDPGTALLLLDLVLGYGSHPDPAGALAPALREARKAAEARGGYCAIVASVTGTAADPQDLSGQIDTLRDVGCVVMPSNWQAATLAGRIVQRLAERRA